MNTSATMDEADVLGVELDVCAAPTATSTPRSPRSRSSAPATC
jgi:hypothetical protein